RRRGSVLREPPEGRDVQLVASAVSSAGTVVSGPGWTVTRVKPTEPATASHSVEFDLVALAMLLERGTGNASRRELAQAGAQPIDRVDPLHVGADRCVHVAPLEPYAAVHVHGRFDLACGRHEPGGREWNTGGVHHRMEAIAIGVQ